MEETIENQRQLAIAIENKLIQEKIDLELIISTEKLDEKEVDIIQAKLDQIQDNLASNSEYMCFWDENGEFNYFDYRDEDDLLNELHELNSLDQEINKRLI